MRQLCLAVIVWATLASPAPAQTSEAPVPGQSSPDAPAAAREPGRFRRMVITFVRDMKHLKSKESIETFVNGGVLALLVYPVDLAITVDAASSRALKAAFGTTGKLLGEEVAQAGSALAVWAVGRAAGKPRMAEVGADLLEAQALSAALTQTLKFALPRTRPDGELRSFPSGHASASFATATVLHRRFGRKAAIPAYAIASYISASRLQGGSHFASDVIMGAALGIVVGRAAAFQPASSRLHVTPFAAPGGGGVRIDIQN